MPVASIVIEGALWLIEDLGYGYLATRSGTRTVVADETFQGLVYLICDEMKIERIDVASCMWTGDTPVKGLDEC